MNDALQSKKIKVVKLSVTSNSVLVVFKLIIGFYIGSISVLSEAIHSGIDLAAALIAYFAVRSSAQPADKDHHYGHGKFENVSGFVEAILIFLAAAWIIIEAVKKLATRSAPIELVGWGILVMALSSFVNMAVSHQLFKIGSEADSVAIKADAWHLRTDVYTSMGVMGGLALIWLIELAFPGHHVHWIDPLAAILVAGLIIKAAYDLTVQSLGDLLDASLPKAENELIRSAIRGRSGVISFKGLRTRKSGGVRFIEFDMLVQADITVEASHALADEVTAAISSSLKNAEVTIHIEPCKPCPPSAACAANCVSPCKKP